MVILHERGYEDVCPSAWVQHQQAVLVVGRTSAPLYADDGAAMTLVLKVQGWPTYIHNRNAVLTCLVDYHFSYVQPVGSHCFFPKKPRPKEREMPSEMSLAVR